MNPKITVMLVSDHSVTQGSGYWKAGDGGRAAIPCGAGRTRNAPHDGGLFVDILTGLPAGIPAAAIAGLYLRRWTLETTFQHVEKHFNCEIETLAYPKAALFGFAMALVGYNIFSVMISTLDCTHGKPASKEVSRHYTRSSNF